MVSLFPPPALNLPKFSTLLIYGPYHPSAPIHLALTLHSELGPKARTLLLGPSKLAFQCAMSQFKDFWLHTFGYHGRNSELASNITILYPPTPVHLSLVLSMFHIPQFGTLLEDTHPKTTEISAPSLIILAELSQYFSRELVHPSKHAESLTLSSYLSLVTRVFSSIAHLTSGSPAPRFVLFDSQLDDLKLPFTSEPSISADEILVAHEPERIHVLPLVSNLFQWVGRFEDGRSTNSHQARPSLIESDETFVPSSQGDEISPEEGVRKQLRLSCNDQANEEDSRLYRWTEIRRRGSDSELEGTHFIWPME